MADFKKSMAVLSQRRMLINLMTIAICYQLAYQVVMWRYFSEDETLGPCVYPESPTCFEHQLFQSWQETEADQYEPMARPGHLAEDQGPVHPWGSEDHTQVNAERQEASDLQQREAKFQELYEATATTLGNRSNVTGLEELQAGLDARFDELRATHQGFADAAADRAAARYAKHLKWQAEFERLFNETAATVRAEGNLTPWAKNLEALQVQMQARMDELDAKHKHLHVATGSGAPSAEPPSVLEKALELGQELCSEPERHGRAACAQFLKVDAGPARVPNTSAAAKDQHAGRIARRRNLTEEAKLQSATMDARLLELAAGARQWETQLAKEIQHSTQELCAHPARADYPSCRPFLQEADKLGRADVSITTASDPLERNVEKYLERLQWRGVANWKASKRLRGTGIVSFTREQLRHAKWQGALPKVACVSVIVPTRDLAIRMKYFVNNFRLQDYEGSRQLILVYPNTSSLAARVVKQFADGYLIKAVADRSGHFPSTAAFRYGAWSSDAEVVARWDFGAWHHPRRIAMQVRAMALAARPAGLLAKQSLPGSSTSGAGKPLNETGDEASLMGERTWMWEHWYPELGNASDQVLDKAQAHNIVRIDMPDLLKTTVEATAGTDLRDTSIAGTNLACRGLVPQPAHFARAFFSSNAFHPVMNMSAGAELGRAYTSLAGRREQLSSNLNDFCTEAKQEHNQSRLEFLRNRTEQIADVQTQLDTHFSIMALFLDHPRISHDEA